MTPVSVGAWYRYSTPTAPRDEEGSVASELTRKHVLGHAGSIVFRAVCERFRPGRPRVAHDIPRSVEQLTTSWLTSALCGATSRAHVVDFELGDGSDGTTSRRAITVTYNETGQLAGLPTDLFTKATPTIAHRLLTVPTGVASMEALFYNTIRPGLRIAAPLGYYAACDRRSGRSMFLLEDVSKTRGCTFGDSTKVYIDRSRAEDIVRVLGTLHGTFWNSARFESDLRGIKNAETWQLEVNKLIRFRSRSMIGIDRAAHLSPAEFLRRRDDLWPAFLGSLARHRQGPMTLLHSDVHSRNWYVDSAGRMGLYDWQCITKGHWGLDLAYALTSSLTVEDRRAWEGDLLRQYAAHLEAAGGPALSQGELMIGYRQQIFHGLFFWLFTLGAGLLEPTMQPPEVSLANLERMTNAVVDLEALDSFG
ncbi:phosphotransferase [Nocardia sp. ET3-3]|uniref:Phosphotransferase n=1 Tax=Nocardia terrae TaxID=2675851 RepID=A0A7K1V2I2_9NOCA|nr:aminoglycoside phosphotransferase family protein [Nocardia terrae]MVU80815.1 phosphotransferase [Nocardia terrae]